MSLMDKVKFWKKDDDLLDLDSELPPVNTINQDHLGLDTNTGIPSMDKSNPPEFSSQPQADVGFSSSISRPIGNPMGSPTTIQESQLERDLELVNSKLDAIKHAIDSMDQRLKKIEHIAEGDKKETGEFIPKNPWGKY